MNISQPTRYGGALSGEPADIFDPRHYANVREPFDVARALPGWCFTSEAFYERELRRMFMRTWNCIGHVDRIPNPGDYLAVEFARVPIVVVRDETGAVRAFSNSCRHRGSVIAEGEGNISALKCPYHNWTYALDGTLIGMPHVRDDINCKMSDNDLIPVRLETWAGMMFVNFDPESAGLADWLGDLPAKCAVYKPDEMVFARRTEYELKANWKLFAEGNMEGYHVFCLHKDTLAKHKVSRRDAFGRDDVGGEYTSIYVEHGATRGVRSGEAFPEIEGVDPGTWFFHIFPASLIIFGVDLMSMTQYYPTGCRPYAPDHRYLLSEKHDASARFQRTRCWLPTRLRRLLQRRHRSDGAPIRWPQLAACRPGPLRRDRRLGRFRGVPPRHRQLDSSTASWTLPSGWNPLVRGNRAARRD